MLKVTHQGGMVLSEEKFMASKNNKRVRTLDSPKQLRLNHFHEVA